MARIGPENVGIPCWKDRVSIYPSPGDGTPQDIIVDTWPKEESEGSIIRSSLQNSSAEPDFPWRCHLLLSALLYAGKLMITNRKNVESQGALTHACTSLFGTFLGGST